MWIRNLLCSIVALSLATQTLAQRGRCPKPTGQEIIEGSLFDSIVSAKFSIDSLKLRQIKSANESGNWHRTKEGRLLNRALSQDFYDWTNYVSDPSSISFLFLNGHYTFNEDFQKKPFKLNAQIRVFAPIGGKWFHARGHTFSLHLEPFWDARILANDIAKGDSSLPVRTPSYMPGASFFYSHRKVWGRRGDHPFEDGKKSLYHHYLKLRAYHHSNGQDGIEVDTVRSRHTYGSYNTYNGDFGNNLIFEFGAGGLITADAQVQIKPDRVRTSRHYQIQYGHDFLYYYLGHERVLTGLDRRPNVLIDSMVYGQNRINLTIGYSIAPFVRDLVGDENCNFYAATPWRQLELFRFILNATIITDPLRTGTFGDLKPAPFRRRVNTTFTTHFRIPGTSHASVFGQIGYYGSDPYNAYFMQDAWFFRFGVGMGFFRYDERPDKMN